MPPPQVLHVAVVCAGYNSSREIITLMKSVLFYRYRQAWTRVESLPMTKHHCSEFPHLCRGNWSVFLMKGAISAVPRAPCRRQGFLLRGKILHSHVRLTFSTQKEKSAAPPPDN